MRDDRTLLQWLLHVEQGGICVIYDAPREQGTTVKICDRVGFAEAASEDGATAHKAPMPHRMSCAANVLIHYCTYVSFTVYQKNIGFL